MSPEAAIRKALEIYHLPSQVSVVRKGSLPDDTVVLLEIVSGREAEIARLAEMEGREPQIIRAAAAFFVEQILFAPDSDSYRILGASPDMSTSDIRRHMALLSKWVHPDVRTSVEHATFSERISQAWEDIKTPERRAAYDARSTVRQSIGARSRRRSKRLSTVSSQTSRLEHMGGYSTSLIAKPVKTTSRLFQFLRSLRTMISS